MEPLYIKIKETRKARGLTQQQLAERVGYTDRSTVARIEAGEIDLPQSKIIQFAEALGVSPRYLMGWSSEDSTTDSLMAEIKTLPDDSKKHLLAYIKLMKDSPGFDPDK